MGGWVFIGCGSRGEDPAFILVLIYRRGCPCIVCVSVCIHVFVHVLACVFVCVYCCSGVGVGFRCGSLGEDPAFILALIYIFLLSARQMAKDK